MASAATARFVVIIAILGLLVIAIPAATIQAQTDQRCFPETTFCITGRIREFWEQNGGLPVFGFPIGPQQEVAIEGHPIQAQLFERNRLELHPENARPYDVLLGRLGVDRLAQQGRDWQTVFAKTGAQPGCRFFPETNQSVCGGILTAWHANGLELDGRRGKTEAENLALFGVALSGLVTETLSDGKQYQVQWFERGRFELHPENVPPYTVLLGLLGTESTAETPVAPPPPAACDSPPAAKNADLNALCVHGGDVITMTGHGFRPDEKMAVEVITPDGTAIAFLANAGNRFPDQAGNYHVEGALSATTPPGIYAITMHGTRSRADAVGYLRITAADPAAPVVDHSLIPASINGAANPISGPIGTTFRFTTSGFDPGAIVEVYGTAPDGTTFSAPFRVTADQHGNAGGRLHFQSDDGDIVQVGIYATTFESTDHKQRAVVYLRVTP